MGLQQLGGFRLFKVFGITVYLHWSWILVALYQIQSGDSHQTWLWNAAVYLSLFAIVLMHEFGHALACRSVGGQADRIVLWPLGGVAFVSPPARPGAWLWSIAAGPLVNLILLPVLWPFLGSPHGSDFGYFLTTVADINLGLLLFNILPIYPLDGGQILRALFWFVMGPARSLMVSAIIGMAGAACVAIYGAASQVVHVRFSEGGIWLCILAAFGGMQSFIAFKQAMEMRKREKIIRRPGLVCPACHQSPPVGPRWICPRCQARFDAFDYPISCPGCGMLHQWITCLDCGSQVPYDAWRAAPVQVGAAR